MAKDRTRREAEMLMEQEKLKSESLSDEEKENIQSTIRF